MSPDQLVSNLRDYEELLVMCDYDGTLVPIAPTPAEAIPGPRLLRLLSELVSRPGLHMAVISGRSLTDLQNLLPVEGLYLAGFHGSRVAETHGSVIDLVPPLGEKAPWREIISIIQAMTSNTPGFFVEDKGQGVALHYRLAEPEAAAEVLGRFRQAVEPFLHYGLELLDGHKVIEVRQRGANKGRAVTHFTQRWPRAFPIYLGDDRTDEDAFAALQGKGWAIGVGQQFLRHSHYIFESSAQVVEFLGLINRRYTGFKQ